MTSVLWTRNTSLHQFSDPHLDYDLRVRGTYLLMMLKLRQHQINGNCYWCCTILLTEAMRILRLLDSRYNSRCEDVYFEPYRVQLAMVKAMKAAGLPAPHAEQIISNILGLDTHYCYVFANWSGSLDAYLYNPMWNHNNNIWHHYCMKNRTSQPNEWNASRSITYLGAKAVLRVSDRAAD